MFDTIRQRASLLFVGLIAFLLILASLPTWDSGWVQAIGSIAAIASGFGYVGLQHRWQRKDRAAKEAAMRRHVGDVALSCVYDMEKRLKEYFDAAARKEVIALHSFRDGLDILADELLTVSPTECDSSEVSSHARALGLQAKAFAHRANEISNTKLPPLPADLLNLQTYTSSARVAVDAITTESRLKGDKLG